MHKHRPDVNVYHVNAAYQYVDFKFMYTHTHLDLTNYFMPGSRGAILGYLSW
jgi:hypothetical protein